jgi:enoyl-CoA hydratase
MSTNRREFVQSLAAAGALAAAVTTKAEPAAAAATDTRNGAYEKYKALKFELKGEAATVTIANVDLNPTKGDGPEQDHWQLGEFLSELRGDGRVRVVVITGPPGEPFHAGKHKEGGGEKPDQLDEWYDFNGIRRIHQEMAESDKIFIAKVNGDAISMGSSLVFAADIIVAREDAVIADQHMGDNGSVVPGDGGCALVPLFMTPVKAKEYLLLAKPYTGAELARMGVINYAVPSNKLDATVDDIVARLLKRPRYALSWAKRVANKRVTDHLNMVLDVASAYEQLNKLQYRRTQA